MKSEIGTGDIYLLELKDQFGHIYKGVRPYVVIDTGLFINSASIVCVSPLTGNISQKNYYDIYINKNNTNGLAKDSVIKLSQLTTVDKRMLKIYIGNAGMCVISQIHISLRKRFNL